MNTTQLKNYAPEARNAFIAAVTAQAARLGVTATGIEPAKVDGDVLLVGGQAFPSRVAAPLKKLIARIEADGFDPTMEAIAYTWFNRIVAIRYMELHGYLDHGYRVLSHPDDHDRPEILDHAADVDLPGLDRGKVVELKLDGTKDEALYRLLLLAQCNALNKAMPFLFDRIGNETELLLPAGLLHTDSLIRKLVEDIDESAWEQIEVIGWLYQFYISEKKDQVIGKVVKSEDIPAATQLFTPNWIVKYMVQNTLGAQWLATYPQSPLKAQMEYYIEPAEQTDEVEAQLKAITPTVLNPEELTLIDPACGSGHILVEAYEILKAIYLERGYRLRDVPKLILEKNLLGFDIDERAAQLSGFALMMKGRSDDRRLFDRGVTLNIMALVDSAGVDVTRVEKHVDLSQYGLNPADLHELKSIFEHATTFGSFIEVPERLSARLPGIQRLSERTSQDLFLDLAVKQLWQLARQAGILTEKYDAVVTNPPYMGAKSMNGPVKLFAAENFPAVKTDLFAISTERFLRMAKRTGFVGLMTPFTWMFLKSYEALRALLLDTKSLRSLIQPEYHAFFDSAYVPVCTFVVQNSHTSGYSASFINLSDFYGVERQPTKTLEAIQNPDCGWFYRAQPDEFSKIPGAPIAYWVTDRVRAVFDKGTPLGDLVDAKEGLGTRDDNRFLRLWHEVSQARIGYGYVDRNEAQTSKKKWFPCNKGGPFRKWFGNQEHVVNWEDDGDEIKSFRDARGKLKSRPQNQSFYFRQSLSWSGVTSGPIAFRLYRPGSISNDASMSAFATGKLKLLTLSAFCNSPITRAIARAVNPTLNFKTGNFQNIPFIENLDSDLFAMATANAEELVGMARDDWNSYERSSEFQLMPLLRPMGSADFAATLESRHSGWVTNNGETIAEMKDLEEKNNALFVKAYGLGGEISAEIPLEQISLTVNSAYRYGGSPTEQEQSSRFREDTMKELVSYAIGCMMGRYSLDEPGLIYANSSNAGFDATRYKRFPADDDGIVPLTDTEWFDDDASHRFVEFMSVAWDEDHLEENLTFLADNLSPKKGEASRDTIRRYLTTNFFKAHLKTYKKRPIYWLFSSGKQKAFQALVYLHRYNDRTLARMRSEYVIPLQGKMAARIEKLKADIEVASSTAHRKRLQKEHDKLEKQQVELLAFDEKLRHYADRRIGLDLDDGVKVNYGKFGDLLAEVKKVHGKKPEGA